MDDRPKQMVPDALRLAIIEGQLSHIAEAVDKIIEKQAALNAPMQDQAIRLARVESTLADISKSTSNAHDAASKAHTRVDEVKGSLTLVRGIVIGAGAIVGMMAWALKDQLEITRQLPVVLERKEAQIEAIKRDVLLLSVEVDKLRKVKEN